MQHVWQQMGTLLPSVRCVPVVYAFRSRSSAQENWWRTTISLMTPAVCIVPVIGARGPRGMRVGRGGPAVRPGQLLFGWQ